MPTSRQRTFPTRRGYGTGRRTPPGNRPTMRGGARRRRRSTLPSSWHTPVSAALTRKRSSCAASGTSEHASVGLRASMPQPLMSATANASLPWREGTEPGAFPNVADSIRLGVLDLTRGAVRRLCADKRRTEPASRRTARARRERRQNRHRCRPLGHRVRRRAAEDRQRSESHGRSIWHRRVRTPTLT
jgi:hypothetical protein